MGAAAAHDRHRRPHARRACGPGRAEPARRGQDGGPSDRRQGTGRANGFANNDPGLSRTQADWEAMRAGQMWQPGQPWTAL